MKQIEVVAAIIRKDDKIFATQRGYGDFKDWWEFPGGKMEAEETPEEALKREIREELSTEISVDEYLCTVEYDYPAFGLRPSSDATRQSESELPSALAAPSFHLTMHCYLCSLLTEALHLNEHEAARWLSASELESVEWLPADWDVVRSLKKSLSGV
ncbi:MAG: (deoxy)nucleoside triphosphate pyrophosphohydrolase [Prevotella sp.]|nr:(deoxy)nucleoside triphosphate pyrophosphohydrolase [Prevotella sp.]